MKEINNIIDIEEAKKVFHGNDSMEKASYASMVGRTMINLDEKSQENLEKIMEIIIECVIIEKSDDAKESMFMALQNMVILNDGEGLKNSIEILVGKLGLLKDNDLAEALIVIKDTFDVGYLELMKKYKTYPNEYVKEIAEEGITDLELTQKIKDNK